MQDIEDALNRVIRPDNSKEFLKKTIRENEDSYDSCYVKLAIVKQDRVNYLYLADIRIQHGKEPQIKEAIYDYQDAVLATIPVKLHDLQGLIDELESGQIIVGSLKDIKAKGGFENDIYVIPSKTKYAGFYEEWPSWCLRYSLDQKVTLNNVASHLVRLGQPSYPSLHEACRVFFGHEYSPTQYSPVCINFMIPDFRARINTLEIGGRQISVLVERREHPMEVLRVKIYSAGGTDRFRHSEDLNLDSSGCAKIHLTFVPDQVHAWLIDLKGNVVDYKEFGHPYAKNDGVIVRTTVESLESMIAAGEDQNVEFKRDLDGKTDEFLESVVSFANTRGGSILLGIDDEGRIVGHHENFGRTERRVRGLVSGRCEPDINISMEEVSMENRQVVIVRIEEGKNKPYLLNGKSAFKRVGERDLAFKRLDFDTAYDEKRDPPTKK